MIGVVISQRRISAARGSEGESPGRDGNPCYARLEWNAMRFRSGEEREDPETHLAEVIVGSEGLSESQFLHYDEAGAVRKRIVLVTVPEEEAACLLGTRPIDPFPS